jgi:RimJ/RimL family protein N-acetyltransferase
MRVYLQTERLLLRELTEDDAALLLELDSDPEVMRYIGPYALPDEGAYRGLIRERILVHYAAGRGHGCWAVLVRPGGAFLGWIFLRPASYYRFVREAGFRDDDLELGYRFRRAAWGRGYATEAARAVVRKAFTELGAERVVACAMQANTGSVRVMEKAGLRKDGVFFLPDSDEPDVRYALSRPEYGSAP